MSKAQRKVNSRKKADTKKSNHSAEYVETNCANV